MSIRFTARGLRDENGKIFLVPYKELLEVCMYQQFYQRSISDIIYGALTEMTGEKVIKHQYKNQSKLYQWLEKNIRKSTKYVQTQAKMQEEREKAKRDMAEYKKNNLFSMNDKLERLLTERARKNYR